MGQTIFSNCVHPVNMVAYVYHTVIYLGNVLSLGCVFNDVQELAECNTEIIFNDETESRNVEISETAYFNLTNLIILRNKYYR